VPSTVANQASYREVLSSHYRADGNTVRRSASDSDPDPAAIPIPVISPIAA
jgi:hypothetical protein